jgi:uncharacterized protein (DUF433 family)
MTAVENGGIRMTTVITRIVRRPHSDGVEVCVRDTNIHVWGLVERRRLGWSDERILQSVQGLTPADLVAAWEYAATHPEEMDRAIQNNAGD